MKRKKTLSVTAMVVIAAVLVCLFLTFTGCSKSIPTVINEVVRVSEGTFLFGKRTDNKDFDAKDNLFVCNNPQTTRDLLISENGKIKSAGLYAQLSNHRILGDAVYMIDNGEFGANLQGLVRYNLTTHKKDIVIKPYYCTIFEPIQGKLLINVSPESMGIMEERITVPSGLYLYTPETDTMELLFEGMRCIGIGVCGDYAYLEYYQDEAKYLSVFDASTKELKNTYQYDESLKLPYSWCPNDADSFYLMTEQDIRIIDFSGAEEILYQGSLPSASDIVKGDGALYFLSSTAHKEGADLIYTCYLMRFDLNTYALETIQTDLERGFLYQWGNQLVYIARNVPIGPSWV